MVLRMKEVMTKRSGNTTKYKSIRAATVLQLKEVLTDIMEDTNKSNMYIIILQLIILFPLFQSVGTANIEEREEQLCK